jgi:hypothetical protein
MTCSPFSTGAVKRVTHSLHSGSSQCTKGSPQHGSKPSSWIWALNKCEHPTNPVLLFNHTQSPTFLLADIYYSPVVLKFNRLIELQHPGPVYHDDVTTAINQYPAARTFGYGYTVLAGNDIAA